MGKAYGFDSVVFSVFIKCSIFILLLGKTLSSSAQAQNYVIGQVLDVTSGAPIPFAAIVLKHANVGVYSNQGGDFQFKHRPAFRSDSLVISCIGYERQLISYRDLMANGALEIRLKPTIYETPKVEIVAGRKVLTAGQIVRRALRRITKNYPIADHHFISYYRDYQTREKKYFNLNEAIIHTQDFGFRSLSPNNRHLLLDYRENHDFERMDMSPYYDTSRHTDIQSGNKFIVKADLPDRGGNELFVLMIHDAIRNHRIRSFSVVEKMVRDFINHHQFQQPLITYNDDLRLYRINFRAEPSLIVDSLLLDGTIYIQPDDYSIHKLEYRSHYLEKGVPVKKMFELVLEYGYEETLERRLGLHYISFNNLFKVVDVKDTTFFKVVDAYWNPEDVHRKELFIKFNHFVDTASCTDLKNYKIELDGKNLKIANIRVAGKGVKITMQKSVFDQKHVEFMMYDLKNEDGRYLNHKKYLEFYQFRELFVQDYLEARKFSDPCFIKDIPLSRNCIFEDTDLQERYWMNTPMQY